MKAQIWKLVRERDPIGSEIPNFRVIIIIDPYHVPKFRVILDPYHGRGNDVVSHGRGRGGADRLLLSSANFLVCEAQAKTYVRFLTKTVTK
jgi:hypothetical protein